MSSKKNRKKNRQPNAVSPSVTEGNSSAVKGDSSFAAENTSVSESTPISEKASITEKKVPVTESAFITEQEASVAASTPATTEPASTADDAYDELYSYGMAEHWELEPGSGEDTEEETEEEEFNRANVNRLKKMIIIALFVMFMIPTVLCVILMMKMHSMQNEMDALREETISRKQQAAMQAQKEISTEDPVKLEQQAYQGLAKDKNQGAMVLHQSQPVNLADLPDDVIIPKRGTEEEVTEEVTEEEVLNGKKVYLTFDDGPSESTGKLLDILKRKGVKATFFMVLNDTEKADVIRRMADEGHALGIHSASHVYSEIYANLDAFEKDVETVHDLLYEITGQDVKLYRFPGGSSNRVSDVDIYDCIQWLTDEGYTYYDWNALNEDAEAEYTEPSILNANVLRYIHGNSGDSVVLMHDLDGHPESLQALPELIDKLLEEGYELVAIDENTEPVQHRRLPTEEELAAQKAAEEKAEQKDEAEQ